MKRIFHLADTHIGYSAYRRIDEATGLNQREVDTYEAFKQFVDYALKERPDVIVHGGDLFDSVRPTNRAISFVLGQLIRLSEAGIPFVMISGNHETPRLKETGNVFSLFEHITNVHAVYENHYELVDSDDLKIHAIPHCDDIEGEKKKMIENNDSSGFTIARLHASVLGSGLPAFMM
ncbi:MAG: DNA repair exonuclease, partial [archaeon]|nr:DNA repair exonuclease [archaeon]